MISISRVRPQGLGHYHRREDAAEKPGHWFGKGAKSIQLKGEVKTEDLQAVAFGKAPNGMRIKAKRSVWRNGEYRNDHQAGYDAVFSPPKSASILGAVGGDKRIEEMHQFAAEKTLSKIEDDCTIATIRTGGQRRKENTKNLIAATFDHTVTRPDDNGLPMPQIHRHTLIFNSTKCSDGKWRRLENEEYFKHQKLDLRRTYIRELGEQMKEVGYGIHYTRDGLHFEVDGVTREQELAYSPRTKQMEQELGKPVNEASFKQKRYANLKTRKEKASIPLPELQEKWKGMAKEIGLEFDMVPGFQRTPKTIPLQKRVALELSVIAIAHTIKAKITDAYEKRFGELSQEDLDRVTDAEAFEFIRPQHLSKEDWKELVIDSAIAPQIASASFETVGGQDAIELVLGPKLEQMGGQAQQYVTKPVQQLLETYAHLEDGGMWCAGTGEWGQLKPKAKRRREGKEVKYESPPGIPMGVMLPKSNEWNWDDIRKDISVPLGVTEGGKKAASTCSQGLQTIGLAGMNGGLLQGDLRDELKKFKWKGRKVYLVLDKDPSHKLKTLRDGARELYKLGAILDYYGADVVIGTIPGKLTEKVGLDDHFVKGRTLADLKWQSLDDFAIESKYLTKKYREHNQKRLSLGLKADEVSKDDGRGFDAPESSTKSKVSSSSSESSDSGSSDNKEKAKQLMPEVALKHVDVEADPTKRVKAKPKKPVKNKDKDKKAQAKAKQSRRMRGRSDRDEGLEI